jgi:hypothetical protein
MLHYNYIDMFFLSISPSHDFMVELYRNYNHATVAISSTNDRVKLNGLLAFQHTEEKPPTNSHKNTRRKMPACFIEKFISRCSF